MPKARPLLSRVS